MSFSSEVKEELAKRISPARHCQIAELAAIMHFSGQYGRSAEGDFMIGFQTENEAVVRKGFTLLKKTYNLPIVYAIGKYAIPYYLPLSEWKRHVF